MCNLCPDTSVTHLPRLYKSAKVKKERREDQKLFDFFVLLFFALSLFLCALCENAICVG